MIGETLARASESAPARPLCFTAQTIAIRATSWMISPGVLMTCAILALTLPRGMAGDRSEPQQESRNSSSRLIEGKVIAIVDGDTLHLSADSVIYVVDLAGIDAPEKGQLYGDMAAQVLYLKVLQKQVKLLVLPTPSANPVVQSVVPQPTASPAPVDSGPGPAVRHRVYGIVYSDGCVNSELVREGIAWHDGQACPSDSLARAQEAARKGRRGLWQSDQEPVPPWQWRSQRRAPAPSADVAASQGQAIRDLSRLFEATSPPAVIEAASQPPAVLSPSPPTAAARPLSSGDRWLTTSSGIRHNSTCRYYKKSKGRPCSSSEGRPCQKCGG